MDAMNAAERLLAMISEHGTHRCHQDESLYYILPVKDLDAVIDGLLGEPKPIPSELVARVQRLQKKARESQRKRGVLEWSPLPSSGEGGE